MLALVHHPLNCRYLVETTTAIEYPLVFLEIKNSSLAFVSIRASLFFVVVVCFIFI